MVGDGANDSMALAQAHVGIAVHGGMEMSLRAADIYLGKPGVKPIAALIVISRETLHVIRRNLWLSIIYNLIAGGFALAGKINPLVAALLMPASALTVFLSTLAGTPQLKKALQEVNT
jgi:Cu2+-exporting ATPase